MLAPLDNGIIFKETFTDKTVFTGFVKDIVGIDIVVDKIETEKKFGQKVDDIDFSLDIFAESVDQRVVVAIQCIEYDYKFDRLFHCFMMSIAELQKSGKANKINRTVYSIVMLTAPYRWDMEKGRPFKKVGRITSVDPEKLQGKAVPIDGHKLIFLNHHFRNENTPPNYRDWLDLFYASVHHPEKFIPNLENDGICKAVELLEMGKLDGVIAHEMKIHEQRKIMLAIVWEEGFREGLEEVKKKKAKEMAIKMLKKNLPIEDIGKFTELTEEEIKVLM